VKKRIFFKLMVAFAVVIAAVTITMDLSIRRAWENSLRQEIQRNLTQKTLMLANRVNTDRQH
jgi:sensor domain CHASE-containing protein